MGQRGQTCRKVDRGGAPRDDGDGEQIEPEKVVVRRRGQRQEVVLSRTARRFEKTRGRRNER